MIDAMKANLFGVMVHPIMPQCIVTGLQENQMIVLVKTALSCMVHAGMTTAARRSMAISVKDSMVSLNLLSPKGSPFNEYNRLASDRVKCINLCTLRV